MLKFHINPKSYEWMRSILVEGGLYILICDFLGNYSIVFRHFKTIVLTQWVNGMICFSSMCLYASFKSICSLILFHLSKFRSWISPPNVFLGKFQHLFSTLKHYNLPINAVKWPQIWSTSSKTCTLQDLMVEIFIL